MKQAYHDHELMSAHVLAGPTVEQQGEMARSGGRMLATLEPEQVIIFADSSVGFQSKSCCEASCTVKPAVSPSIPQVP